MKKIILPLMMIVSTISFAQSRFDVEVSSNKYTPKDIVINVGDTVVWTNIQGFHNVNGTQSTFASNTSDFGNTTGSGWTYTFVFSEAGFNNYQCDPHAGLGMTGTVTVNSTTSIVELNDVNSSSYPNPTTGIIYLSEKKNFDRLEIINSIGEIVKSTLNSERTIDASELPKGNYIIKFYNNNDTTFEKIIIQ
jgi:plastocyanin